MMVVIYLFTVHGVNKNVKLYICPFIFEQNTYLQVMFHYPLGTVRPLYRTGVSLLSREHFLNIQSTNVFHYLIFV